MILVTRVVTFENGCAGNSPLALRRTQEDVKEVLEKDMALMAKLLDAKVEAPEGSPKVKDVLSVLGITGIEYRMSNIPDPSSIQLASAQQLRRLDG